jgi:low affinity Fe/Cu permease
MNSQSVKIDTEVKTRDAQHHIHIESNAHDTIDEVVDTYALIIPLEKDGQSGHAVMGALNNRAMVEMTVAMIGSTMRFLKQLGETNPAEAMFLGMLLEAGLTEVLGD